MRRIIVTLITSMLTAISACGGKAQTCMGTVEGAVSRSVGTSDCISFSSGGLPPRWNNIQVALGEGVSLEIFVPIPTHGQWSLPLVPSDMAVAGASIIDYRGFEGGMQSLCATSGLPASGATGKLELHAVTLESNGTLRSASGHIDATFTGCNIPKWPGVGSNVRVDVSF
jgi:hypothetical protein